MSLIMKKVLHFIVNHPFCLIIPGIALCCLDIKPLGVLLMIVGGIIFLFKKFGKRDNASGTSSRNINRDLSSWWWMNNN